MKADVSAASLAGTLFELAKGRDAIDAVTEDLQLVQKTLDHTLKFKDLLRNTQVSSAFKERIISEIFSGRISDVTLSFLAFMARVTTVTMLPKVAKEFSVLAAQSRKRVVADVTTAVPIDAALKDSIWQQFSGTAGKEVQIRHHVDPSIIGGIVIKIEGETFDSSVSRQLDDLRVKLGGIRK